MSRTKEIITAAGTLVCALGIGLLMQSTDSARKFYGNSEPDTPRETLDGVETGAIPAPAMVIEDITLTSALADLPEPVGAEAPVARPQPPGPLLALPQTSPDEPVVTGVKCRIDAQAHPAPKASVALTLGGNCPAGTHIRIRHEGVEFDETLDEGGQSSVTIPALAQDAVFSVEPAGGAPVLARVNVEDLGGYQRVVLQWQGRSGFELHAREFGALYGGPGHVWHGAPRQATSHAAERGGYLTRLGDESLAEPRIAEIYTFPAGMSGHNGQIDLSIEAEVTAHNCGHVIRAETLEFSGAGPRHPRQVSFSVPGCEAQGDFLVLNNVFQDLKIAAR